jgi:general secretion pathway protein D
VEFDGFINYGSPINTVVTRVPGVITDPITGLVQIITSASTNFEVTQNIINKPVFSTREVTTEVTVYDGQTVVIGGLISENIQKTEDKVPILGDIPLAGRLFRTTADQHIKRNLIMFVTASLLDPAGQPLIKSDEEGEILREPSATAVEQEAVPGDAMTVPQPQ